MKRRRRKVKYAARTHMHQCTDVRGEYWSRRHRLLEGGRVVDGEGNWSQKREGAKGRGGEELGWPS